MADPLNIIPEKTAFVSIDLQKGITGRELAPYKAAEVLTNAGKLVEAFRRKSAFVVLVNVTYKDGKDTIKVMADQQRPMGQMPPDWAELVPELSQQPSDLLITKRQWGAFHGTELDLQLRRRGIDTIVLCGISTNIGVETTAREAYQHGYNLIIAIDACTAMSAEEHESSRKFTFPRIARIRTTEEILAALK